MDKQETIFQRIKSLRKALNINQREFSTLLSLSSSYISGVEAGLRPVNDRLVKLIVSQFGVNSEWLINGEGEIFTQKNTDERTTRLLSLWTDLPRKYQDVIFGVIDLLRKAKD